MSKVLSHSRWTRRQALRLMAGAAGSVGLNACTRSIKALADGDPSQLTPMSVGSAPWIGCTPLYIAQEKNFFQDAGLKLNLREFGTNLEGLPAFSAGQLQGAAPMTISEASSLLDAGIDLKVVGIMDLSAGGDAILARNSIGSIEDFKGKEVVVQRGGVGHFFLLQVLAEVGLSEKDIRIIDADAETSANTYQAGNAEIAYTYSPFLEKANAAQKDGRIIYDSSKMPTAIIDLYVVRTDFAQQQPQAVEAFLDGIFRALDFLNTQPQESHTIAAQYLEIQPQEVATQLRGVRLPDLPTHQEMLNNPQSDLYVLKSMQAMAEFLKDQGQIKTVPDLSAVIDPQYVTALSRKT